MQDYLQELKGTLARKSQRKNTILYKLQKNRAEKKRADELEGWQTRPSNPQEVKLLATAEHFLRDIKGEIGDKIAFLQNPMRCSLSRNGEKAIKQKNLEINRLLHVRDQWERRVVSLGGKVTGKSSIEYNHRADDTRLKTNAIYYFGCAKELPEAIAQYEGMNLEKNDYDNEVTSKSEPQKSEENEFKEVISLSHVPKLVISDTEDDLHMTKSLASYKEAISSALVALPLLPLGFFSKHLLKKSDDSCEHDEISLSDDESMSRIGFGHHDFKENSLNTAPAEVSLRFSLKNHTKTGKSVSHVEVLTSDLKKELHLFHIEQELMTSHSSEIKSFRIHDKSDVALQQDISQPILSSHEGSSSDDGRGHDPSQSVTEKQRLDLGEKEIPQETEIYWYDPSEVSYIQSTTKSEPFEKDTMKEVVSPFNIQMKENTLYFAPKDSASPETNRDLINTQSIDEISDQGGNLQYIMTFSSTQLPSETELRARSIEAKRAALLAKLAVAKEMRSKT